MKIHTIKMPDIGEGIAEVELVAWHVKPGDAVKEDQPLADVMTDKANVEIPSPVKGTVLSLGGEVGQVMAVGSELIRIEVESEVVVREAVEALADAGPSPSFDKLRTGQASPQRGEGVKPGVRREAAAFNDAPSRHATPARTTNDDSAVIRPIASPSVRRRAWEYDIDLRDVHGSGPGGRIMHSDIELHIARHGLQPTPYTAPSLSPVPTPSPLRGERRGEGPAAYAERDGEDRIPVIGIRRKIAQKMQESKRRIPHFTYVEEIDVTEVESLRAALNAKHGQQRGKLTMLPFIARALVLAVRDFPQVNARFDDEAGIVTRYGAVHVGVAAQTDAGLMVPVMRHAETRDLWSMAREIGRLADSARDGRITRDELTGSTITITSLGALGGIASTPVINHPEVAIVGVNRIVERPAFRAGAVVPRQLMNLSSSFDHRVVDGMDAARFIQAIRALLETPATLFVE